VYSFASTKWKAKCRPELDNERKDTRCAVDAEKVIAPVLTVKTISVLMMLPEPLMPLRD